MLLGAGVSLKVADDTAFTLKTLGLDSRAMAVSPA
jgi:hypothetical protein